ncbi:hypothetical protein JL05_02605 [Serratia nematodiphila DZ0503SBS1]|nr:hypothetical protein JL05_02605 [Serratia nematodiphila DZ0503SBS1]
MAGGTRVAYFRNVVGQFIDQVIGVEIGLHHGQVLGRLLRRQRHVQSVGELLEFFGSRAFDSHKNFLFIVSCFPLGRQKPNQRSGAASAMLAETNTHLIGGRFGPVSGSILKGRELSVLSLGYRGDGASGLFGQEIPTLFIPLATSISGWARTTSR